jgi:hypothetical protein
MAEGGGWYASELRRELMERSRAWAKGRLHVESYGTPPVIVFAPDHPEDGTETASNPAADQAGAKRTKRHGNFFDAAYAAILARPEWLRRFNKVHAQGRALPKAESGRRWREIDSSMSSDALLLNFFAGLGSDDLAPLKSVLGVYGESLPEFGWKARVPLAVLDARGRARFDRTEVDMRWGDLLVEAKLTESNFQTRSAKIVEGYRDFDAVFDRDLLPRVALKTARRRTAVEFAEAYTQEWEEPAADESVAHEFQAGLVAERWEKEPAEPGYLGYQLIRNVLAAYAEGCSFCVLHDARRPDLREQWFAVMAAVKSADMRTRCKGMTWQELAAWAPQPLQAFLGAKYGIFP